jgi:hypothetical protein
MNKKALTETDIRTKFITPALVGASGEKWNVMTQIREEAYFTKGRVIVRGKTVKRGEAKKADYILYYKPNVPLAVLEAKDNNHSVAVLDDKDDDAIQVVCRRAEGTAGFDWDAMRQRLEDHGDYKGVMHDLVTKLGEMVKRILNKYGYPPDLQEAAVKTVLMQAELLCAELV